MINLDELREKLTSKEERLKVLDEINDITYLNVADGLGKTLKNEGSDQMTLLHDRAEYLRTLVNLCFEQIENLEEEK
ncbi:MAG: hypothetical protein KGI25_07685 [Thaumarchaeota archaeon]|nr:hypothetical protein [Nitrososphaerota archaeon]